MAARGLFTVDRQTHDETCFSETVRTRFDSERNKLATSMGPAMRKLTLVHSEAGKLLRLLAFNGVSAATVYPGYSGIAQALEEQRTLWDFVPHPSQKERRT